MKASWFWAIGIGLTTLSHGLVLKSPNGLLQVDFEILTVSGQAGTPVYRASYSSKPILLDSRQGLTFSGTNGALTKSMEIQTSSNRPVDSTWAPVYGQWKTIRNHFNELTVNLRETVAPNRLLMVIFRAYDEGVAFCYTIPTQTAITNFTLTGENSEFHFTADHTLRANLSGAQSAYEIIRISQLTGARERPLTLEPAGGPFISLAEARMVDFCRTRISLASEQTLQTTIFGDVVRCRALPA